MKIVPQTFSVGACVDWTVTSPDQRMFDWDKFHILCNRYGVKYKDQGELLSKYKKKNKKRALEIWDKIFENSNISEQYQSIIRKRIDGFIYYTKNNAYTFTEFLDNAGVTSKTIKNRVIRNASEYDDKIISFNYGKGYIRHDSEREPFSPYNKIEVLFGIGEKYIYSIYKLHRETPFAWDNYGEPLKIIK